MHLKSINLLGFKSFIDKTQIKLDDGISCIVGPNGSGKSNIADAVRWVLGEQSAKTLRGQKMEDIIFSGSDNRKSVGMAEVSLNIDNSDGSLPLEFAEVVVCRRTYRSGDSEYLINGKQCRLKDLQELFLDSGIGNNSLAMVGQGRVHEIVSMKPEERRSLIEEAAGVVKYRNRKRTTLKKLNDTEQNLARIWDIISELKDRIGPLEEQSVKARRYLELKQQADSQEINLLLQVLHKDQQELDKLKAEMSDKQRLLLESETQKSLLDSTYETTSSSLQASEENLNNLQQQLFNLKTTKEREEAQSRLLVEKLNTTDENIKRLNDELTLLLNRDDGFMLKVDKLEQDKTAVLAVYSQLKQQLEAQEELLKSQKDLLEDLNGEQELTRNEIFDNASNLANAKNELSYQEQSIQNNDMKLSSLKETLSELESNRQDASEGIIRLKQSLADLTKSIDEKSNLKVDFQQRLDKLGSKLTDITQQEVASRLKLNGEQSRLKVLTELHDNLDGYYPGVRALLKQKKQGTALGNDVIGVVVELIESDSKYNLALEAALAGSLQYLVVEDDSAAKKGVAYLKEQKLGRATFLPIKSLVYKLKPNLDKAIGQPGVIGRASDIINCDAKVRPVVQFLLANILLVEDLNTATRIAKENNQQFKIITLEGDVISPGGSITGGSRQKTVGDLLRKKNQLVELKRSVELLQTENQQQIDEINHLKQEEVKILQEQENELQNIRNLEMEVLVKEKDLNHLQMAQVDKSNQVRLLNAEIQELQVDQERLIKRKEELATELVEWQAETDKSNQLLTEVQQKIEVTSKNLEEQRTVIETDRLKLAQKQQEEAALASEIQRLRMEKSDIFKQEAEKKSSLGNWEEQSRLIQAEIQANSKLLLSLAEELSAKEEEYSINSNQVAALKNQIGNINQNIREYSTTINSCQQDLHQMEIKETKLQAEWSSYSERLQEDFELEYEAAMDYLDMSVSRTELTRNIKQLRREIAELGNVNLDSIDEYAVVSERFAFLSQQREDLLAARDSLNKVIKEMDTIMIKRFKESFEQVNKEFNLTFNKLFGGGSAGLVLTNPDDMLETGVDMMVQPPGKRLVNYNLLSGGEKSLIGIALVLAIFQVKPSPFCVLDEVDAALDEANVDRFAEYLQNFAQKTQFIVISHRQGTMEAAGSLWGVTMEESGVSKMVSVRLSDMAV